MLDATTIALYDEVSKIKPKVVTGGNSCYFYIGYRCSTYDYYSGSQYYMTEVIKVYKFTYPDKLELIRTVDFSHLIASSGDRYDTGNKFVGTQPFCMNIFADTRGSDQSSQYYQSGDISYGGWRTSYVDIINNSKVFLVNDDLDNDELTGILVTGSAAYTQHTSAPATIQIKKYNLRSNTVTVLLKEQIEMNIHGLNNFNNTLSFVARYTG